MKSTTVVLLAGSASAAVVNLRPSLRSRSVALVSLSQSDDRPIGNYGDTRCPCIGFDRVEGETMVTFTNGTEVAYPADLGARCEAWDDDRNPSCKEGGEPGIGKGFCAQTWCYVDACNCDIPTMPKVASYVPDARFQGKPVFYSYTTCGSKDMWADEVPAIGSPKCRCIGFDNIPGTIDIRLKGSEGKSSLVSYPAEIGGTCSSWDEGVHPMCKGKKPPQWCTERWCYVDPCSCKLSEHPKVTMYLPDASFSGMSLYYSYETCGSKDHFTEEYNTEACVNQESKDKCLTLSNSHGGAKCAWAGESCLGWEIVEHPLCKKLVEKASKSGAVGPLRLGAAALALVLGALVA